MHRRTDAEAMPTPARRCAEFFRIAGRALDAARRAGRSPGHRSHRAVSYRLPRVRPTSVERRHHKGPVDGTRVLSTPALSAVFPRHRNPLHAVEIGLAELE